MYSVYILYSGKLERYYIGSTDLEPQERLFEHNSKRNNNSFTTRGIPWELFFVLFCNSRLQARQIELHIKKMKSRKYIQNLKKYPEMQEKLLVRYQ
jgi:putative endonuclease